MIDQGILHQFTGTEEWTQWSPLFPKMLLTDGAKYVAGNGGEHGAYWLMDAIASYQSSVRVRPMLRDFQLWTLTVDLERQTGLLECREDSGMSPEIEQAIEYTDFDLPEISFYVCPVGDGKYCIMLRSEY